MNGITRVTITRKEMLVVTLSCCHTNYLYGVLPVCTSCATKKIQEIGDGPKCDQSFPILERAVLLNLLWRSTMMKSSCAFKFDDEFHVMLLEWFC